jgi:hypothetical protein
MGMLRRLAVVGMLTIGTFAGAASASASAPSTASAVAQTTPSAINAQVVADPDPTAPIVDVTPSSDGMPGAELVTRLLSWLSQLALWGSLASILAGATVYGLAQNSANYNGAYRGKQLAVAGAIGAALAGLAPTAITMLFRAAGG